MLLIISRNSNGLLLPSNWLFGLVTILVSI